MWSFTYLCKKRPEIALLKQVANLHGKDIGEIKKILNYLIETPEKPKHQIGFKTKDGK